MLYIIYVADINLWIKYSLIVTYADDTSSRVRAKTLEELKLMLEEDAKNMPKFMASNGLVTNESKTALILQNVKGEEAKAGLEITIGQSKIKSQRSAKLLGMNM